MKASFVSSSAISEAMRYSLMKTQADLVKAQKENATGFVADKGLALGVRTAQSVTFNRELERVKGIIDSNALAATRLSATQEALDHLAAGGQAFLATLTTARSGALQDNVLRGGAEDLLESLIGALNTSVNGEYIFAGINTDVKPIDDFFQAGSATKTAYDDAYAQYLSDTGADPANPFPTAADMDLFSGTYLEPLFMGAGWSDWSSASDQPITSRISLNETNETSVSANHPGVRKMAMAATMISQLLSDTLADDARAALVDKAMSLVASSLTDLTDLRSQTGIAQKRLSDATDRLGQQSDLMERHILSLEGVDPYEVATRVSELMSQIETAYSLTTRIRQLSLLRYLS